MDIFSQIAERKITEAIQRGDFDHLELKGQKLDITSDPYLPAELAMGYKLLKNAGVLPEELSLDQEVKSLNDLLSCCTNADKEKEISGKIRRKLLQLNILLEKRGRSAALQEYLIRLEKI